MFHILQTGADAGAFNLDKIGIIKERSYASSICPIRLVALFRVGLKHQRYGEGVRRWRRICQSGIRAGSHGLSLIKDPLKQNEIGVALFRYHVGKISDRR